MFLLFCFEFDLDRDRLKFWTDFWIDLLLDMTSYILETDLFTILGLSKSCDYFDFNDFWLNLFKDFSFECWICVGILSHLLWSLNLFNLRLLFSTLDDLTNDSK